MRQLKVLAFRSLPRITHLATNNCMPAVADLELNWSFGVLGAQPTLTTAKIFTYKPDPR